LNKKGGRNIKYKKGIHQVRSIETKPIMICD
jgi:hypothetical protein